MQRFSIFLRCVKKFVNCRSFTSLPIAKIPDKSSFNILPDREAAEFTAYFPEIVNDIVNKQLVSSEPLVNQRMEKVLQYNIPNGKHVIPHFLVYCYKFMESSNDTLTPKKVELVNQLAWCWETKYSTLLMMDDIMDGAELRRGKKTWYKLQGSQALCDILLLQSCYLKLLEKYFSGHVNYSKIVQAFFEAMTTATVGETIQFELRDFDFFTLKNFRKIAKLKTVPITFDAPFRLACLLSDKKVFLNNSNCRNILSELGILYQIQNDFHDCYRESIVGKKGNDIQENLCTILITTALKKASPEQRRTLRECYGHYDPKKVKRVKEIYDQLEMENQYHDLEYESYRYINTELEKMENHSLKPLMENIISFMFGKNK